MTRYEYLLPAVAMMLGWGLRGFIGGGPFGAMIPGAMVALCLCLLYRRRDAAMIAAFAAIGVGIGGQMTYGQTVGFIVHKETFWWGFLGLALKGGVWGLVAGAVIGMAFTPTVRIVTGGALAMAAAAQAGWKFFNEPKVVYFSNLLDRPRPEVWFGFLLAGAALLGWLGYQKHLQPALRLALAGFVGGFIGFGFGGAIQGIGRIYFAEYKLHWWKYMEFTFGFCFGWALAWAMKRSKLDDTELRPQPPPLLAEFSAAALCAGLTFWLTWNLPSRFAYLLVGGVLLVVLTRVPWLTWHVALSITFTATMLDSARYWSGEYKHGPPEPAYAVAILLSVAFAWLVRTWVRNDTFRALELLTWGCVADATFKFAMGTGLWDHVAFGFILMAIWQSWMARKVKAVLLTALLAAGLHSQPLWTVELGAAPVGPPVVHESGIAVALSSGKVALLDSGGANRRDLVLDAAPMGPPIVNAGLVYAADVWGGAYCFRLDGASVWRYRRASRAGNGYSAPVLADINGDRQLDLVLSDTRGSLYALNSRGDLRFEIQVTTYRLSTPAVADTDGDGVAELYFGADDERVYSVRGDGTLLWSTRLPGARLGRAMPLVADLDADGAYEVYVTTPFVGKATGLHSLDARTGTPRWHARTELQTYASLALADVDGDGREEILVGDKNTRLYAVSAAGRTLWSTQMPGRGVFFAPVVAGTSIYQVARDGALHELSLGGQLLRSIDIGGGAHTAALRETDLVVSSRTGRLHAIPATGPRLWSSWRHSNGNSGWIRRAGTPSAPAARTLPLEAVRVTGRPGSNRVEGASTLRVAAPDGSITLSIGRPEFTAVRTGQYSVLVNGSRQLLYTITHEEDDRELLRLPQTPLGVMLAARVRGEFAAARLEPDAGLFDNARASLRQAERVLRSTGVVEQLSNPWTESAETGKENGLSVRMLGNEYESIGFTLTNRMPRTATYRLETEFELRQMHRARALSTGRMTEDLLPKLQQGNLVTLQPGEVKRLWMIVASHSLSAGTHERRMRVGALESLEKPVEIPVRIVVSKARLPQGFTYKQCHWLYPANITDPTVREAVIADALAHGTNVFPLPPPSHAAHDSLVKRLKGQAVFLAAVPPRDAQAVRGYVARMTALGLTYSDWAYYVLDEPGLMGKDAAFDAWVDDVARIKQADPHVRIYANPAGGATREMLEPVKHLVSIWQPDRHLVLGDPEGYRKLFQSGEYWHYEAPADQRNLDPLGFYRMKPWVAFQMGMTGGGYWVHSHSPYWFFDPDLGVEYGAVYMAADGPVTTKRWEASRDGAEDFELLWALRGSKLAEEAVAFVTKDQETATDISRQVAPFAPDYQQWMAYRHRLIDELEKRL